MQFVNPNDFNTSAQNEMDATLLVRFYPKPREDKAETLKQGRPIFHEVDYIEIRTPGSRDAIARPASQRDIERFPRHYEAYKNRTTQEGLDGTPLNEWPAITRSQVEELGFFSVKTVEQLIAMPDSQASQFMGINTLKAKAKAWLEGAEEGRKAEELAAELKKRDDEIAELKAAVKALQAKPKRKKVTRKKKVSAKKE